MTALVHRRAALALALALAGCGAEAASTSMCQRDDQCGADACVAGRCLPRAAPPAGWNVELAPKADSPTAAFTELVGLPAPADGYDLTVTSKVTVTGTLTFDPAVTPLQSAHIVLKVPALIPGRPALQYETDLLPPTAEMPATTFTVPVPANCIGRTGSLQIVPTTPDDLTHPPAAFTLPLAAALPLTLPSKLLTVRGRLLSAADTPLGGLIARAFANGNLASNVVNTTGTSDADKGMFTLLVAAPEPGTTPPPLAVELEPAASDAPVPHFWAKPVSLTANTDFGDVHLPAYQQPNLFKFAFTGPDAQPVTNAIVRAHTLLADDAVGTTDFLRDGVTDAAGQISLSLLPGSTVAKRLYDIAIVPPASSPFATTCLEMFPVVAGGVTPVPALGRRPVFAGTVTGADGLPVDGVVIVATLSAVDHITACDEYAGTPQVTTTTDASGAFSLNLDAGIYTLDFDPPAGAAYPRLTRKGVVISASSSNVDGTLTLPAGAVVEGTIRDASMNPVPLAGVRFYGSDCAPTSCVLQAQAHADAVGHFRAVIPLEPPANM